MHLGIPMLQWEKEIPRDFLAFQYVANPADVKERGIRIMFQTSTGEVGRIILTDTEADWFSRKLRDTLADNGVTLS